MLVSLYFSFTDYNLRSEPNLVAFGNYYRMFVSDSKFLKSVSITLYYVFVSVPLKLAFALLVAVFLNQGRRLDYIYRSIYYLPSLIGGSVAVSIIWKELFSRNGAINSLLRFFGIPANSSWLGSKQGAIWTLILLAVWQFGSSMIIFAAGIKQIPSAYYEAARIDGASAPRVFTNITLPILSPVILFNLIMQIISGFTSFTQAFVITQGGPLDSTLFYALYIYRRSFEFFDMGYGSAMAWIMLIIIAGLTALIFKFSPYWVYYESKGGK